MRGARRPTGQLTPAGADMTGIRYRRRRAAFLRALGAGESVAAAARAARLAPGALYGWRESEPEFRRAWDAARLAGQDAIAAVLEAEADKRATRGYREPIHAGGKLIGHRRKYSDALLMFRLRALRPQLYAAPSKSGEPVLVELRDLDAEEGVDGDS